MIQIKFTKFGSNSAFGGFAPGDILRAPESLARHLVEEAKVAEYMQAPAAAPAAPAPAPVEAPAPRARKTKAP